LLLNKQKGTLAGTSYTGANRVRFFASVAGF